MCNRMLILVLSGLAATCFSVGSTQATEYLGNGIAGQEASWNRSPKPDKYGVVKARLLAKIREPACKQDHVVTPTFNSPPIADAGSDLTVPRGTLVILDGSRSRDADGDLLTYHWLLSERPPRSRASLQDANSQSAMLLTDRVGSYVVMLTVHDGTNESQPDEVVITVPSR